MPPFDRRRPVPERTAGGRTAWSRGTPAVFTSDDLDRDLSALMQDPLYWRERDKDFADHVTRQFERVHGPDGPRPDADGKRRGTLEVPRLSRRPGDGRLRQPVGRGAPNRPDDVTRLQRALSETGDYTFTAPRERSGVMTPNLETALTRYQRRTGLKPDGYAAPDGPTVQQITAEAERGFSDTQARAELTSTSGNLVSLNHTDRLPETANAGPDSTAANADESQTARTDTPKKRKSQCGDIKNELHAAHEHMNRLSDKAHDKSIEIDNMRKAIAKVANLEKFVKQEVWDGAVGVFLRRVVPPVAVVHELKGDIERINTLSTLRNMRGQLQGLLNANKDLHDQIENQMETVERLKAEYTACLATVAPEDRSETAPGVPAS